VQLNSTAGNAAYFPAGRFYQTITKPGRSCGRGSIIPMSKASGRILVEWKKEISF
jgi:hypothetical protein